MADQNESMRDLQALLVDQFQNLHDSLKGVTDPDVADAIVREMQEVSHRVALTGSLLFAAQAAKLDSQVADIGKATKKVDAAIAQIQNIQAFLGAMSDFLGLVDQAIDFAKLL
jgi:flagellin-like hook-associated protein FlgL